MSKGGTISVASDEAARFTRFAISIQGLEVPPGTRTLWQIGHDIAGNRNQSVRQLLESEDYGDWLWFIDTDMLFAPSTLERLLAADVDMIQVLVLMRHPPHEPVLYEHSAIQRNPTLVGPPRRVEVQSLGAGGTLYRKRVFEAVAGPWFEGIIGREDTGFAQKAVAAGFKLYVDLATPAVHLTPMGIRPVYDAAAGTWAVQYDAVNGDGARMPFRAGPRIVRPSYAGR